MWVAGKLASPLFAAETLPPAFLPTVTFTPATGSYYRPGSWTMVHVNAQLPAGVAGVYRPELRVLSADNAPPIFSSQLPPVEFKAGGEMRRLSFWVLAGTVAPRLQFALVPRQTARPTWYSAIRKDILFPLAAGRRLVVSLGRAAPVLRAARFSRVEAAALPRQAGLYESCDLLILSEPSPQQAGGRLSVAQLKAIAEYIVGGGVVLTLRKDLDKTVRLAIEASGWRVGQPYPYALPRRDEEGEQGRSSERKKNLIPTGRHAGRGQLIFIDARSAAGLRTLAGGAVWKKLLRDFEPATRADRRLVHAQERYRALGASWPPPPRLSQEKLLRWVLAWLLCSLCAIALPLVRKHPGRLGCILAGLTVIFATVFSARNPVPETKIYHAQARLMGQGGGGDPTFAEEVWFVAPFGTANHDAGTEARITLPFYSYPPPRLLAYSAAELDKVAITLTINNNGSQQLQLADRASKPSLLHRATPLLFWRDRVLAAPPAEVMLCKVTTNHEPAASLVAQGWRGKSGATPKPLAPAGVLYEARLKTKIGGAFLPRLDSLPTISRRLKFASGAGEKTAVVTARGRVREFFAAEHPPGNYATLLGWESSSPKREFGETDLGILRIYGLRIVRGE